MLKITTKQAAFYVAGVIVVILLFRERSARASSAATATVVATVDFETPTVIGSGSENLGGTDYQTRPEVSLQ